MFSSDGGGGRIGLRVYGFRVKFAQNIGICLEKLRDYGINVSYGIGIFIKKYGVTELG